MKKYILLSLLAFILACLILCGIIWRLETKEKIKFRWNSEADSKALTLDRLIRELIPDAGQTSGKWEVLARQEDPVDWKYEDSQGFHFNPRIGTVKLVGDDGKPIPGHGDILLKGDAGYTLFGISHDSIFDIDPKVFPVKLQKGEQAELLPLKKGQQLPFVNKKAHYELYSVQLKGKAPAQLLIEWPGENNKHVLSIYGSNFSSTKKWDPNDDVFEYTELVKRRHIQLPLFSKGDWKEWWKHAWEFEKLGIASGSFIIEKNGTIINITFNYHRYYNSIYKEQAETYFSYILKNMPQWMPGKINGKPIRVRYGFGHKYK